MNFATVDELLKYHTNCLFCELPLSLLFKDYRNQYNEFNACNFDSDSINLQISQAVFRNVKVDISTNFYQVPAWNKDLIKLSNTLSNKKIKFYKSCDCNNRFQINTSNLIFNKDGYLDSFNLESVSFKIQKDNSSIIIINDYKNNKTTIIDIVTEAPHVMVTKGGHLELPLIKFDTIDKHKILQKIKTLITFS